MTDPKRTSLCGFPSAKNACEIIDFWPLSLYFTDIFMPNGKHLFTFFTYFFPSWVFFHEHLRITELQGKEEGIPLTPHYHFHPLHRHLDISWAIAAESSPLHIGSNRARTGNLWLPGASR